MVTNLKIIVMSSLMKYLTLYSGNKPLSLSLSLSLSLCVFIHYSSYSFTRYSSSKECLEVCLGDDHVPIGPLTIQQKALALINGQQSKHDHNTRGMANIMLCNIIVISGRRRRRSQ